MSKKLLFVYGSLREGFGNHPLLIDDDTSKMGTFTTEPIYEMLDLGAFPGVVLGGQTPIVGEVYEVNETIWARVEALEGYPSFYNRVPLATPYGEAKMYILQRGRGSTELVESGDWSSKRGTRGW
jgi:gamma-glutamylcyclotransferase (GGCT)/AIG2-like uncharacterized protein YtfP